MQEEEEIKYAFLDDNDINALTPDLMAPWDPYFLKPPAESNLDENTHAKLVTQWANKKAVLLSKYGATATMFPDITPKVCKRENSIVEVNREKGNQEEWLHISILN